MNSLFLAYILLAVAFAVIAYYGVGFLLKKWEKAQEKQAEDTVSHLEEMFVFLRKKVLIALYIIIPLFLGVLGFIFTKNLLITFIFLIVGAFFPFYLVKFLDKKRRKKFQNQLPDGLMILSSCLKGGLTLPQSFEIVTEEMKPPISQEIGLLVREIKVGVPLDEALVRLEERMPSEEMTLIVSAILVARETGGDLTKVFSRLIETIRDRMKLKELIQTLTLQARLQAFLISLLGPAFVLIVLKINPNHFDIMWQSDIGKLLIFVAVVLQIIGIFLIIIFGKIKI